MAVLIADFAGSVLALGLTISATSASVSDATSFPTPAGDDYFYATIEDSSGNREIVKVTEKVGNVFTIERAKGGTSARAFDAGSAFQLRFNALTLTDWKSDFEAEIQVDLDAMQDAIDALSTLPVGAEVYWPSDSVPDKFFEEDGSEISRSTYSELFSAIGTRYGTGDGSTTFNLPDARGLFVRNFDNGAGNDPDSTSRTNSGGGYTGDTVGSLQGYQVQSHRHQTEFEYQPNAQGGAVCLSNWNGTLSRPYTLYAGGNETRPINAYRMLIMKYE